MSDKRAQGRFYTLGNPFLLDSFKRWASETDISDKRILEPFAGANHLIHSLAEAGLCDEFMAYDIAPGNKSVKRRDTIASFPKGYDVCITNPPWLARNSATRRGLPYPETEHDDIYKLCLELCLKHCSYVGALVPASYLQSGLFRDRLSIYILLHNTLFSDTENPVCLALFNDKISDNVSIYYDDKYIGELNQLSDNVPASGNDKDVRFNDPRGNLGFISFDSTKEPSIKFCRGDEIKGYKIKESSRFITRISGNFGNTLALVKKLNKQIKKFRKETSDIFLTPFKGLREDGNYRRRMDFGLARRFINAA